MITSVSLSRKKKSRSVALCTSGGKKTCALKQNYSRTQKIPLLKKRKKREKRKEKRYTKNYIQKENIKKYELSYLKKTVKKRTQREKNGHLFFSAVTLLHGNLQTNERVYIFVLQNVGKVKIYRISFLYKIFYVASLFCCQELSEWVCGKKQNIVLSN